MIKRAILHTDGGSRGNPGPSGIGFVILVDDGRELVTLSEGGDFIGEATNNVAEYHALIWGLENALALEVEHLDVRLDSELLVKQIKGEYKVRNEGLKPLFLQVLALLRKLGSFKISHVYREDNARADALANKAMDAQTSAGSFQVPCAVGIDASYKDVGARSGFVSGASEKDASAKSASEGGHLAQSTSTQGAGLQDTGAQDTDARNQGTPIQDRLIQDAPASANQKGRTMKTGRYALTVKDHFDAAHALVNYPGECCRLHGHTWDIEVTVSGVELDEIGIVYDFKSLKADLAAILCDYDHKYLNEVPPFDGMNATAENLARVIYERLEEALPSNIQLDEVGVWESPIAKLTYRRN